MDYSLLAPHIRRNILSLNSLKQVNYPIFIYIQKNREYIENSLDIKILEDTKTIRGIENIKLYLLYYYGETVNLTKLREENIVIYNNICALGVPEQILKKMGFKVKYRTKISQDELIKELSNLADEDGAIEKLNKRLDNKIRYEANKVNMTVREYLEKLGFFLAYGKKKQ